MEGVRKHAALAHAVSLAREREQSTHFGIFTPNSRSA